MVGGSWSPPMVLRLTFRYEARAVIPLNCREWQFKDQIVNSIFMLQALAAPPACARGEAQLRKRSYATSKITSH